MAAPSRTAQLTRLHKILKKHYTPVSPDPNRTVLEHLLFASCLENAHYAPAEEAFGGLVHTFFDWNEVRVSSIRELSEVMAGLPEPAAAANRVKRVLQSIFEATYCFDLEALRKLNLGPAVERLTKIEGTTPFSVAYAVQVALAGHSIPLDAGTLGVLRLVDLVSEKDAAAGIVPGLERAISKQHGLEFASLLHQLGADFVAGPYRPELHGTLLEIEPAVRDRLPTRRARRSEREAAAQAGGTTPAASPPDPAPPVAASPAAAPPPAAGPQKSAKVPRHADQKQEAAEAVKEAGKSAKEPARKPTKELAKEKESPVKDLPAGEKEQKKAPAAKKKAEPAAEAPPAKRKPATSKAAGDPEISRPASSVEGLAKRKPR